ncbi:MAG: hypothetical protein HKM89_11215 [Gemmatimonadales bacterium]|nr:hypothetical protein [Gemmatimonadales bacterium]
MRTPRLSDERGIALVMAVFAIVVIGALVAGTFFAGRLEQRTGLNAMSGAQSFEAAEAGLTDVLDNWDTSIYNAMATGDTMTLPSVSMGGNTWYVNRVTRMNDNLFQIISAGAKADAGGNIMAQRVVGTFARLIMPLVDMTAAITVNGTMTIGGSTEVSGVDENPVGWSGSCATPTDTLAGIRSSSTTVNTNGANCSGLACVEGDPQFQGGDPTVDSTIFNDFGGISFDELAAMADIQVSGTRTGLAPSLTVAVPPRCDRSDDNNWGEPYFGTGFAACFNYFPIIYAPHNVRISGGRGQGILLVEGDLELSGGMEFYGPVIVQGRVRSTGTGGHIFGGLMAAQVDLDPSTLTGNSLAQFSSCALERALRAAATARPLGERAWMQVYSLN